MHLVPTPISGPHWPNPGNGTLADLSHTKQLLRAQNCGDEAGYGVYRSRQRISRRMINLFQTPEFSATRT